MAALETIETETGPNPGATIIVLHGLGADGNDFVPIAQELDLAAVGPVRFVFPHAPVIPVTINNGYRMRAWYDILGMDLVLREDEAGLRQSLAAVEELLAREKKRGMPADRIVLAGFSQGCAMALADRPAAQGAVGGHRGHVGLSAAGANHRRRTQRRQRAHADLHGPRPARQRGGHRARQDLTRGVARAGLRSANGTSTRWRTRSAWKRSATSTAGW